MELGMVLERRFLAAPRFLEVDLAERAAVVLVVRPDEGRRDGRIEGVAAEGVDDLGAPARTVLDARRKRTAALGACTLLFAPPTRP